jgi:excisionase family DNA binding protein
LAHKTAHFCRQKALEPAKMSKKYLSLEEAAQLLAMAPDELVRLRERGEIRGFADRGTWKFKQDDVDALSRRLQTDSNPEVPLFDAPPIRTPPLRTPPVSRPAPPDVGEQPTVIRRDRAPEENLLAGDDADDGQGSDSDVRLVGGSDSDVGFDVDSDSDVKLVGLDQTIMENLGTDPEIPILKPDSDSDVKLIRPDSDSDVTLAGSDSDSDVQLIGTGADEEISLVEKGTDADLPVVSPTLGDSDSDVRLMGDDSGANDVSLLSDDDDAVAIEFGRDDRSSALEEESGISLGGDSSLLLGESGISLAGPSDSGIALDLKDDDDESISLALDDDSGISLDAGESGISLDASESGISLEAGESGISLDGGTMPMMDIAHSDDEIGETQFEIPQLDDDSSFDLSADDDQTGVMEIPEEAADDAVFDLDEEEEVAETGAFDEEDLEFEADALEPEEDLDVFDADEAAFDDAGTEAYAPSTGGRMAMAESEWGTMTFVGLAVGSVCLLLCGAVMIDLVKNIATAAQPNPVSGMVLDMLGGLYKG